MNKLYLLVGLTLIYAPACGRRTSEGRASAAAVQGLTTFSPPTLELDGQKVAFSTLGEPITYNDWLSPQDGLFSFSTSRAFRLDERQTLALHARDQQSADCAGSELSGPAYMILKVGDSGEPEIIRTTEGIEAGGTLIAPTSLATFPGQLEAGTYVLSIDYTSPFKACRVSGSVVLSPV